MKSNINKYIFTEDLDYSQTPKQSIWGAGDPETVRVLKKLISEKKIFGKWLHFAAGDGRYNNLLLQPVNKIVVTDIDKNALDKLQRMTPKELSAKLFIQVQNITKPFPFKNNTFDGVFNTGTLHLFSPFILELIIQETNRVLKSNGLFVFDFATDVKRIREDGMMVGRSNIAYSKLTAETLLSGILKKLGFETQFMACRVPPEKVTSGDGTYTFSCNYWLIIAVK
jgi:SAM-dependent methyltransferase